MLASPVGSKAECEMDAALPVSWRVASVQGASARNPFDIAEADLERVLADLPPTAPVAAELPDALAATEVSSLWLL